MTWWMRVREADRRLLITLAAARHPRTSRMMRRVTRLGDAAAVLPIAAALAIGAVPSVQGAGRLALVTVVVSHLVVQLLKRSIARPRPQLPPGFGALIAAPDRFSFPSGHATASLSVAASLALAIPTGWGALLVTLAILVGVSRSYLGVHYPGDVIAGWLIALGTVAVFA